MRLNKEHANLLLILQRMKNNLKNKSKQSNIFPLRVNYNQTIESLVKSGKYNWSHIDISSELFSTKRKGISNITIELIKFSSRKSTKQVLRELNKNGLRPADVKEILTFGATYPKEQIKYPIVARGSMWVGSCGGHFVPCLRAGSKGRYVDLYWFGGIWDTYYRFAVVRDSKK